jgi:hypothetical protein
LSLERSTLVLDDGPLRKQTSMFPVEVWFAYTAACVLLVISPGPDNLLAVGNLLTDRVSRLGD